MRDQSRRYVLFHTLFLFSPNFCMHAVACHYPTKHFQPILQDGRRFLIFSLILALQVGRALSLSRTPSLKRTMSQIISSPFTSRNKDKDPDAVSQSGSEHSFTPIRNHLSTISLVRKVFNPHITLALT